MRYCPHVALIIETSLSPGRDILKGIARYTRQAGAWSIYYEPRGLEESVPSWLNKWKGDGIIARFQNKQIASAVLATGLPVVDTLNVIAVEGVPVVHVDNIAIAGMAANHLLDRDLRNFGFCNIAGVNWSEERCSAFCAVLKKEGYHCSVYNIDSKLSRTWSWEKRQEHMASWVRGLPKPAGVMVCSDHRAPFLLDACRRGDVNVPDEVAIVGVDNDDALCEICDPPLSSVKVDYEQVGYRAAALLSSLMSGDKCNGNRVYIQPSGVVVRMSSDISSIDEAPVAAAVRYIREHAKDGINVNDVVGHVSMSRSVLQRKFREILHRSIHDEIVNVRLDHAKFLMLESDLPLSVIAEKAGFNHQRYMGAVFKKATGYSPAAYRKAQIKRFF